MRLKLPTYQELSKEQDEINNLPLLGNHVIAGPPGTGKTVMAIYRSAMFARQSVSSYFLVYNRTLNRYLGQALVEEGLDGNASTFHSWFARWYWTNFRHKAPQVAKYQFDWERIYERLFKRMSYDRVGHLTIDEGQDFPREFYAVARLIAENLTVFADENQQLTETNSTLKEIQQSLSCSSVHFLHRNYRNTRQVAQFAANFYTGLPSGIPAPPSREGQLPQIISTSSLNEQAKFIARYERNNPDLDIGVLVETNAMQRDLKRLIETHGTANPVQMYIGRERDTLPELDYRERGIILLAHASSKGLEFDTVFLPALDQLVSDIRAEHLRMRFYVLCSRPREDLYLLYSGEDLPTITSRVPANQYELQRIPR